MEVNAHAVSLEVVDVQPDDRRTFDIVMRSDKLDWMQTVEQVIREPPTRLMTRGGSWWLEARRLDVRLGRFRHWARRRD
jgi:hypothetical protein